ncbi:MAG: hypothetical protein J7L98_05220, partial [Candidatus Verstraetearchaeota archaeon]|nr:hypothetical protein [Candidatus Verstraetearchaeota archaeon]
YVDQHPQLSSTFNLFSLTKTIHTLTIYMVAVELCSFPHSFTLLGYWSGKTPEDRVQGNLAVLLNPDLPLHHRALQLLARLREVKRALAR